MDRQRRGYKVLSRKTYDVSEEIERTLCEWHLAGIGRGLGVGQRAGQGSEREGLTDKARKDSG